MKGENMKKILVLMTTAALCLSTITACGGKPTAADTTTEAKTTKAAETTEEAATEEATEAATRRVKEVEEQFSQDVFIKNSTGVAIKELYFSLSDEDNWGEDMLAGQSFGAGKTLEFTTDILGTVDTMWDVMIVDEDGDEVTFRDINLSSLTDLELHWGADGQTPTVTMSNRYETPQYSQNLDITNSTGVAIYEIYISLSDDTNWGEEMLGDRIFGAGETMEFTTDILGSEYDLWDIRIIDEDGDEVLFNGVDFSASTELVLSWGADGRTPTVTMK